VHPVYFDSGRCTFWVWGTPNVHFSVLLGCEMHVLWDYPGPPSPHGATTGTFLPSRKSRLA